MKKYILPTVLAAIALASAGYAWNRWQSSHAHDGLISGNGRIEATEVDVATVFAGRVAKILVDEGDMVTAGQKLAFMQIDSLQAQRQEAEAEHTRATHAVTSARAQVVLRESEYASMQANIALRDAELDAAERRLARSQTLSREGASSEQELDDDSARVRGAQAALQAARSQASAAFAGVEAAQAQVVGMESANEAALATIQRVDAAIQDSLLTAPRSGRVQFRLVQPGEVIAAGGKLLNLIDLTDVYINFFLPEVESARVRLGSEVRILLDIAPDIVIPAAVSFISSTAQFTPKTVETAAERQKLMFKVKARIAPEVLQRHLAQVKTGLAGVAWIKVDPDRDWPAHLQLPAGQSGIGAMPANSHSASDSAL